MTKKLEKNDVTMEMLVNALNNDTYTIVRKDKNTLVMSVNGYDIYEYTKNSDGGKQKIKALRDIYRKCQILELTENEKTVEREDLKALLFEIFGCEWYRKEGVTENFGQMVKRIIAEEKVKP